MNRRGLLCLSSPILTRTLVFSSSGLSMNWIYPHKNPVTWVPFWTRPRASVSLMSSVDYEMLSFVVCELVAYNTSLHLCSHIMNVGQWWNVQQWWFPGDNNQLEVAVILWHQSQHAAIMQHHTALCHICVSVDAGMSKPTKLLVYKKSV